MEKKNNFAVKCNKGLVYEVSFITLNTIEIRKCTICTDVVKVDNEEMVL